MKPIAAPPREVQCAQCGDADRTEQEGDFYSLPSGWLGMLGVEETGVVGAGGKIVERVVLTAVCSTICAGAWTREHEVHEDDADED